MRRTRVALAVSAIWLAAVTGSSFAMLWLGVDPLTIGAGIAFGALALGGSMLVGYRADRVAGANLAALAQAVGVDTGQGPGRILTLEMVIGTLVQRLERTSPVRTGFGQLATPAVIASNAGEILAVSRGLLALAP